MSDSVTDLLKRYRGGEEGALDRLAPLVYDKLRIIARNHMSRASRGHTLAPTALVNEVFLRLIEKQDMTFEDREHFFAAAAQCVRWMLMDHAKHKRREKRGGDAERVSFDETYHVPAATPSGSVPDLVAIDAALEKLSRQDKRLAKVVELRFLAGLSVEDTAKALETSPATVKRDWQLAKAWLQRELGE